MAEAGGQDFCAGVSIPGIVYSESGAVWAPNIPGWDRYPLRERLERGVAAWHGRSGTPLPLILESDRSAYVTGEAWRGAAAGALDAVFLAVGTGIGAGVLCGGRLVHGHEDVAGDPLLWLCGFLLFFQSGNEFTAGGWISTYLQKTFGIGASAAALTLAGYWAAVMAGRLASARFVKALRDEKLVVLGAGLAFAAAVLLAVAPSGALAMAGAVLLGLGFSTVYPTTLAIVGENFASFTGTAFSFVISVGLAGGMISPWLVGRIAQASSLRHGLFVPVFDCAMILVLLAMIMKTLEARREAGLKKQP